jgi:hypothetical protein
VALTGQAAVLDRDGRRGRGRQELELELQRERLGRPRFLGAWHLPPHLDCGNTSGSADRGCCRCRRRRRRSWLSRARGRRHTPRLSGRRRSLRRLNPSSFHPLLQLQPPRLRSGVVAATAPPRGRWNQHLVDVFCHLAAATFCGQPPFYLPPYCLLALITDLLLQRCHVLPLLLVRTHLVCHCHCARTYRQPRGFLRPLGIPELIDSAQPHLAFLASLDRRIKASHELRCCTIAISLGEGVSAAQHTSMM